MYNNKFAVDANFIKIVRAENENVSLFNSNSVSVIQ